MSPLFLSTATLPPPELIDGWNNEFGGWTPFVTAKVAEANFCEVV